MPITERLKRDNTSNDRIVIYCLNHKDVAEFYKLFRRKLGPKFSDPKYRLVEMYTSDTAKSGKEHIVKSFAIQVGGYGAVICTVAFGMPWGLTTRMYNKLIICTKDPAEDLKENMYQASAHGRLELKHEKWGEGAYTEEAFELL